MTYKTDECDEQLISSISKAFAERVNYDSKAVLVTTKIENLYDKFLENLDAVEKAGYQCNACRRFTNDYGTIVALYPDGRKVSVCWEPSAVPEKFKKAVAALNKAVERAEIDSVFFTKNKAWGIPKTGEWTHFNILPAQSYAPKSILLTPNQAQAEKKEDYKILQRSIAEFDINVVKQAHNLLSNDTLYRSEKVLGVAKWFLKLLNDIEQNKHSKENLVWYAVGTAPPGYCHIRTTMIGTLLEDLQSGLSFEEASKKFASKMNPYQYQRPTAPVSDNQITQAEKLVEKLGLVNSLKRRFARLEDLKKLWEPKPEQKKAEPTGVFSHLRNDTSKKVVNSIAPAVAITWEKFRKSVLPNAEKMEITVSSNVHFYTFVTAEDMEAPPVIQWDLEDNRNPVTWYTSGDCSPSNWNLGYSTYEVAAVSLFPFMWGDEEEKYKHHEKGVLFVLKGCRHKKTNGGGGLFPEHLKSDLHQIRSVLERNSNSSTLSGAEEASAAGVAFRRNSNVLVKVTADGMVTEYKIDRWD